MPAIETEVATPTPASSSGAAGKGAARKLPRVVHTPEMVTRVRTCSSTGLPIDICYQCFGNAADGLPVVLLIGGLNMQLYAWDETFCVSLVRAGFYVIRYDNRDIGYSTKVENRGAVKGPMLLLPDRAAKWFGEELPYRLEDMAADAWALLDVLRVPWAHLIGISMGGMIAQCAALQAPQRTMSLTSIMSSTNAPDLPHPALWVKMWMLRRPPRNCTVDELLEFRVRSLHHLLRRALPPDADYLKKRFLMSLRRSSYAAGLLRQAAAIRRAANRDVMLTQLRVPALVIHGAQDVVVPPMNGYRTATMLPYARMLVLKSMGHYFHPAFFSTVVAAFADMAASTDPTRRLHGPSLPCASRQDTVGLGDDAYPQVPRAPATALSAAEDDSSHAAVTNSIGGGETSKAVEAAATTSPAAVEEATDEDALGLEEEILGDGVDPKTKMMASLGEFIVPVVTDATSPLGRAVCRSVMVAVPGGNNNPAVPEAVIVENLFQRDPHATPSKRSPTVVRRPFSASGAPGPSSVSSADSPQVASTPPARPSRDGVWVSPLATAWPSSSAASACSQKTAVATAVPAPPFPAPSPPPKMEGAVPFVPCSPSCWYELEPFPQRVSHATAAATATAVTANAGRATGSASALPSPERNVAGVTSYTSPVTAPTTFSTTPVGIPATSPSSARAATPPLTTPHQGTVPTGEPSRTLSEPLHSSGVYPVIAGVPVKERLYTHPDPKTSSEKERSEKEKSGVAGPYSRAAAVPVSPSVPLTPFVAGVQPVTTTAPTDEATATQRVSDDVTQTAMAAVAVDAAGRAHMAAVIADDMFLQSEAPPDLVDASSFAAPF